MTVSMNLDHFDKVIKFPLGNTALSDVSFEIDDNQFVFLVGQSGAGKTSILKMITQEIVPTSGSIIVDDFDVTDKNFSQKIELRRKIGIIFQDFKVLIDKNVFENVAVSLKVIGADSSEIKNKVKKALELVGLSKKKWFFLSNCPLVNYKGLPLHVP